MMTTKRMLNVNSWFSKTHKAPVLECYARLRFFSSTASQGSSQFGLLMSCVSKGVVVECYMTYYLNLPPEQNNKTIFALAEEKDH